MQSAVRAAAHHARALSLGSTRAFHSPFASLSSHHSPLTSPPSPTSAAANPGIYTKGVEHYPQVSSSGRTYVVSEPDPQHTPYAVPSGAYPTSAPYVTYAPAEAPKDGAQPASTSTGLAHPTTTAAAPQNEAGVMESSAIRHGEAPGEMGARGGGFKGEGMMDPGSTKPGAGELADRNPPPIQEVGEKWGKAGVDNAWKERK